MTSVIGSFYTLSACIDKIPVQYEEWKAINNSQEVYLNLYRNMRKAKIPEIESTISIGDVSPINKFLSNKGFDIKLSPIGPKDLAIASVLEVILKWLEKGVKREIRNIDNDQLYAGVFLEYGVEIVSSDKFSNPIARIKTKNGDTVFMTVLEDTNIPSDAFSTFDLARDLLNSNLISLSRTYEREVIFPKVDIDTHPDISWIIGMTNNDGLKELWWEISQAMQQTIVKIDEVGVIIKEAVTIGVALMSCSFDFKKTLVINKPFLFVVTRPGLKEPLFSAYLDIDSWVK